MSPTNEKLRALTEYQLRSRAERLLRKLYDMPEAPRKKALKKIKEAIAGKLAQAGINLDRKGRCQFSDGSVLMVDTREYEPDIYRMHIGVPVSYGGELYGMNRLSELSFIEADLPHIEGKELAEFLAQLCAGRQEAKQSKWELFSHDDSYPTYAWTRAATAFYYNRHKERLRYENELSRRQNERIHTD
jgi:hypothetical protein